jgi:hypothetical protein
MKNITTPEKLRAIIKEINMEIVVRKMSDEEIDNTETRHYCQDESGKIYSEGELSFVTIENECLIQSCKGKDNCLPHCPCDCHNPPTQSSDWLKAKYYDIQPYLNSVELRQKIDELFNWFSTKVMETEVSTGLRGFGEVMKERERIVKMIKKNDNKYHAGYYCVEEKIIDSLLFSTNQLKGEK